MDTARILVVDDDLKSQKILRDLLTPDGYELAFAATGFAALQEAARKAPDVILLDVLMPDMDGFEVCRHLRLDPLLAEVSIIMVTSLDDHASRLRGLEVGADEFVTKPFDMIELRARVRNVAQLNRYRKLLHERTKAQRAQAETMSSSEATLAAWVRILERDGRVIPGRCDRVMALALRMGEAMELADADLVSLRWSVLLQSISAMAVPSALRSEGPCISLEEDEMVLKSEAWIIEALSPVAVLNDALEIIRLRHEHWDGSGRPKGLKGEAIPIAARVLAVVLAWESNQSSGSSTVVRLALLNKQTGLHFESKLVVQLERLLEERHEPQAEPAKSSTGIIVLAKESRPSITLLQRCSLTSTGARAQFAVALALISVIPMLVVICLCTTGWLGFQVGFDELWPMVAMVMPFMALGCFMLAKYPVNVIRLRRYLESLTRGIAPKHIALVTDEDDMANIEMLMHKVIKQTVARIHTIETQTEALLDAERQRVMIQSLGAACHHLGQPATVISSYLQITLGMELPPKVRPMLEECRTAAEAVAAILERLQRLTVYRTEPYLMQHQEGADFCAAQSIIKM